MNTLEKLYDIIPKKNKLDRDRDLMAEAARAIEELQEVIRTLAPAGSRDETIVRKLTDYETAEQIYSR